MSIVGIGSDLVFVPRIGKLYHRYGHKFAQRILSTDEMIKLETLHDPIPYLAKRFAAKEALSKALGTGIGSVVSFHDMGVVNDRQGKPLVQLSEKAQIYLDQQGIKTVHISLSDEKDYAMAFVVMST